MAAKLTCPNCDAETITRHLPQEIGRRVDHEQFTVPGESGPKVRRVTIVRITYRRDFLCSTCGFQWSETFEMEKQEST